MCEDYTANIDYNRTGCCITATQRLSLPFSRANFNQKKNNMTVLSHPPYFALFPRLNIKVKGRHYDTTEVMETELQPVLNTLTEHDFQDAFKKWQKRSERCILAEEDYLEGDGDQ
jgi:hypothetical protein